MAIHQLSGTLFDDVMTKTVTVSDLESNLELSQQLNQIERKLSEAKNKMKSYGPTPRLWLQYISLLDLLKSNIRGDRTCTFI